MDESFYYNENAFEIKTAKCKIKKNIRNHEKLRNASKNYF